MHTGTLRIEKVCKYFRASLKTGNDVRPQFLSSVKQKFENQEGFLQEKILICSNPKMLQ